MLNNCSIGFWLVCFLPFICQSCSHTSSSYLLKELDNVIDNKDHYSAFKQARIDSLKSVSNKESNPERKIKAMVDLYHEYSDFSKDSSIYYINQVSRISRKYGLRNWQNLSQLYLARALCEVGLFEEAITTIKKLKRENRDEKFLIEYYLTYIIIHEHWGSFSSKGHSMINHALIVQNYSS